MDLRDHLASRFAAALVDALSDPDRIAARAYELAEAMLRERDRRIDADEGAAIALEPRRGSLLPTKLVEDVEARLTLQPPWMHSHAGLLDEPQPMEPDADLLDDDALPAWLEPPYDPRWELEPHWSPAVEAVPRETTSRPPVPGLARTQPEPAADEDIARNGRSA